MNINYPFAQELIKDSQGKIEKVVIDFDDYQKILENFEDNQLLALMNKVKDEIPLSHSEALEALEH
ncbi:MULTISPECIES: hypothetical protein [unclassified Synechocystis]|uniref:hypothetical protein n=1 Tax=unclassified Synechocystis TaxID=2640012 RepID=UPI0003FF4169|nr:MULTISPECIES: hypothetical protein [unclassified Synechocystis]AIE74116.1 hypothetical protein D082_15880 [Synechocystis sp. PCC 6714]MCT0252760.1 hypothetical protein [Synechocystis sp. CS-94]